MLEEKMRSVIMRGGTSKAVFLMRDQLPQAPVLRDKIVLDIMGSPDRRQIDGLGGADKLTSKIAIIGPPTRPDADVDYLFGQVSIDQAYIDWRANCGNISSAVGPFAIDDGLIKAQEPITTVRIHTVNTGKLLFAEVPVIEGRAAVEGDFAIAGVPGTGAKIALNWAQITGPATGKLLPTGNVLDTLKVEGLGEVTVSIVDMANLAVFIPAEAVGMKGTESPAEIDTNEGLVTKLNAIRKAAAELVGLSDYWEESAVKTLPLGIVVQRPTSYTSTITGLQVKAEDVDLVARQYSSGSTSKALAGTGTICTGVASKIPGTIVNERLSERAKERDLVFIGHPSGVISTESRVELEGDEFKVARAVLYRTARRIMEGYVYLKPATVHLLMEAGEKVAL